MFNEIRLQHILDVVLEIIVQSISIQLFFLIQNSLLCDGIKIFRDGLLPRAKNKIEHLDSWIVLTEVFCYLLFQFFIVPQFEAYIVGEGSVHRPQFQFLSIVVQFLLPQLVLGSHFQEQGRNVQDVEICFLESTQREWQLPTRQQFVPSKGLLKVGIAIDSHRYTPVVDGAGF